jgi:hypothetical protein
MPDISMCLNHSCSKKETCYRYKAKPDHYQSYCNFKGNDCYWAYKKIKIKKVKKKIDFF